MTPPVLLTPPRRLPADQLMVTRDDPDLNIRLTDSRTGQGAGAHEELFSHEATWRY